MECNCRFFSVIFMGLICLGLQGLAQDRNLISGDFNSLTFDQFVHEVEAKTNYHFYFNPPQFDSLSISLKANNKPLSLILDEIFLNTQFHYGIDAENHVFVVKNVKIETQLPQDFFNHKKDLTDTSKVDEFADLSTSAEDAQNEKLKSSLENKLYQIGIKTNTLKAGNATIAGYIRDAKSGETITSAAVYIDNPPIGVTTDRFGYFSFTLPRGRHVIKISSVGMKDTKRQVMLYSDGKLNIDLYEFIASLKSVTVVSEKNSNIKRMQMGVERLNIKTIKQVPVVFGEADVLRAVLTLPGVTSVGESSTGLNVRGGAADENLILFNDATIFNASHFFGFFSSFNPDVVKDVQLYKSSIPEKYGGRLASVLDITTRDGNQKKISGTGGIGPLTARLTLDGPIFNDKTTFILGGRTTYSDWLLKTVPNPDYSQSSASFYDLNLHISHEINAKNNLYLTAYLSNDQFKLNSDTLYQYINKNINLKWKHNFNNKFYGILTGGYDGYQYAISSNSNPINAYKLSFDVNQTFLRADFNYNLNAQHEIDFGLTSVFYKLFPGSFQPMGAKSLVTPDAVQAEQALESAVYLGDHFTITPKLSLNAGIRYSYYNYLGPHQVYNYTPGQPLEPANVVDSTSYSPGKVIKTYHGPEYRAALRYILSDNSSIKASYNTLRQYIHVLSNTTAISPTDVWKLSDPNIQPQYGDQISLGYYQNFKSNSIETSVEVYYKHLHNYLDYKSGAVLVMNHHIETDVITDRGKAYGVELMVKKTQGKLNGWVSYTYSRTLLQEDDPIAGQSINNGSYYPANFDKPNNVNLIGNYKINHRFSISLDVVYSTGRPITLPVAIYYLGGSERVFYSDRNQYRIPDYFRTDLSMNIEGNHKIKKFKHSSWTIGVYNLTGRKNPYSVYFIEQNGVVKGYELSIFGVPIPSITYNFKF
jgi:TonB dependent receptor/CarboxypepD_reg-like domain/TonB-dependent Receptor Plug Domain